MFADRRSEWSKMTSNGFTLVEMLIVVAIVAILAAIAIPQFTGYRIRAYAATLNSDIKNAYTAGSAYLVDNPSSTVDCSAATLPGFVFSAGVTATSCNMTVTSGSINIAGNAGWGLSVNSASVTYTGVITPAQP